MNTLGERIRELREKNNMTQGELAKKIHVSTASISYYESNKKLPSIETVKTMAELFNTSMDYIAGRY